VRSVVVASVVVASVLVPVLRTRHAHELATRHAAPANEQPRYGAWSLPRGIMVRTAS
jgi:hypothetical protein